MTLTKMMTVRAMERVDLPALHPILEGTGLFPAEMLAGMAEPGLSGAAEDLWLVAEAEGAVLGFAFAEPERLTEGTWNLLAIAVLPARQGEGLGQALVRAMETQLRARGGRVLLVETSSLEAYAATRGFYAGLGYAREAVIRDFYTEGEDKVVFWRHLHR